MTQDEKDLQVGRITRERNETDTEPDASPIDDPSPHYSTTTRHQDAGMARGEGGLALQQVSIDLE